MPPHANGAAERTRALGVRQVVPAIVAGLLAAILPARRAPRLNVLAALEYE